MATWNELINEIASASTQFDQVRRKYLFDLSSYRKRNVIAYYSSFLHKTNIDTSINDLDMQAFMATIHNLDRNIGLDLILHTPGGGIAATEAIVNYIRKMFNNDVEIIVPQIAMSAGTMIACSGNKIFMGKHSSLGPIDPQLGGIAAKGVLEEFEKAKKEISIDQGSFLVWKILLEKYHPSFIDLCQKSITWSEKTTTGWLESGMFKGDTEANKKAAQIVEYLSSKGDHFVHERHINIEECISAGLKICRLEENQDLQNLVLTVHHSFMHTLQKTNAAKIVENQNGIALISAIR